METKRMAAVAAAAVAVSGAPMLTTSASAATGVCAGVSSCTLVSRADVDGDGRSDQVGLVQRASNPSGHTVIVRVRTAKGRTMTTSHTAWWYGSTWHGSAKVDGVAGHDMVVGTSVGAHYMEFRVITVRSGRLVTLRAPGGAYRWGVDSSYSFNQGWTRAVSSGKVSMTGRYAERRTGSTHDLTTRRYAWRSGAWSRNSTKKSVVSTSTAYAAGGWRVPYLKRFPTF